MSPPKFSAVLGACLACLAGMAGPARGEIEVQIEKIVDRHTPVPGGSGTFSYLSEPSLDGDRVIFLGSDENGRAGIYSFVDGNLQVVVDVGDPLPGRAGAFIYFNEPAVANGRIAFRGIGEDSYEGIYVEENGTIQLVVDNATPLAPGERFVGFCCEQAVSQTTVAFTGFVTGRGPSIYRRTGDVIERVVNQGTPIPGNPPNTFHNFLTNADMALDGDVLYFVGERRFGFAGFERGLYVADGGLLDVIADKNTIPSVGYSLSFEDGLLAFFGETPQGTGIYLWDGSAFATVLAPAARLPVAGGLSSFLGFPLAFESGSVAFVVRGNTGIALYTDALGALEKVVDSSEPLDGGTLTTLQLGKGSLQGERIAFKAWTQSPTNPAGFGIYLATLRIPPLSVDIDIRPWSPFNRINPLSRGVVPVALLGANDFDVSRVDVTTLAFGPGGAPTAHKKGGRPADVDDDGLTDLVSLYQTERTGIAFGDEQACLTGETLDGAAFEGCDSIRTVSCGRGFELAFLLPLLVWRRRRRGAGIR